MWRGPTVGLVFAILLLLSHILSTRAIGQGADSDEHLCRVIDVQAERCKKDDFLLVAPLPPKGPVSENAERLFVAIAVAQWCNATKPIVALSPIAVVCAYLGHTRERRDGAAKTP